MRDAQVTGVPAAGSLNSEAFAKAVKDKGTTARNQLKTEVFFHLNCSPVTHADNTRFLRPSTRTRIHAILQTLQRLLCDTHRASSRLLPCTFDLLSLCVIFFFLYLSHF